MPELFVYPNSCIRLDTVDLITHAKHRWLIDRHQDIYRINSENLRTTLVYEIGLALGFNPFSEVGFKDLNKLNLCRSNLIALPFVLTKTFSGYRGVSFDTRRSKWIAQLSVQGHRVHYSRHISEIEAVRTLNSVRAQYGLLPTKLTPKSASG